MGTVPSYMLDCDLEDTEQGLSEAAFASNNKRRIKKKKRRVSKVI
jgi:hypothetical protein